MIEDPERSQIRSTSASTWVENSTVVEPRRRDEIQDVATALRVEGADRLVEDDDGGRWTSVPAIPSRWRMPPE